MKILFVLTGLKLGGAEKQVTDLATLFAARGHQVTLVSLTGECEIPMPRNDRLQVIELHAIKSPWSLMRALWRLTGTVRRLRPDVVHSHMVHANLMCRIARLGCPMPALICTAHSRNEGGGARMLAYRLTDRLADLTTNVSHDAVDQFVAQGAAPSGRIIAMPNGIDTRRFHPDADARYAVRRQLELDDSHFLFLAAGRLVPAKDYPTMLRAFAAVSANHPHARLRIAGEGPLRDWLRLQIDDLGIARQTALLGVRQDMQALLNAADALILSSAWEGLPLVVGEAMASECPVISTDCGGVRELTGDTAALVPPGDAAALAQQMSAAVAMTDADRQALGSRARARITQHFSLDAIADRWIQLYNNTAQDRTLS